MRLIPLNAVQQFADKSIRVLRYANYPTVIQIDLLFRLQQVVQEDLQRELSFIIIY